PGHAVRWVFDGFDGEGVGEVGEPVGGFAGGAGIQLRRDTHTGTAARYMTMPDTRISRPMVNATTQSSPGGVSAVMMLPRSISIGARSSSHNHSHGTSRRTWR